MKFSSVAVSQVSGTPSAGTKAAPTKAASGTTVRSKSSSQVTSSMIGRARPSGRIGPVGPPVRKAGARRTTQRCQTRPMPAITARISP